MTLETFVLCFQGIITECWAVLSRPIILGTYSLWNVFQGVFACWAFKVVIVDGVLNLHGTGVHTHKRDDMYFGSDGRSHFYKK